MRRRADFGTRAEDGSITRLSRLDQLTEPKGGLFVS
jgi:hypothetical protein